jgi:hypothetical protein
MPIVRCGFEPQRISLAKIYRPLKDMGLKIDFMGLFQALAQLKKSFFSWHDDIIHR